MSGGGGRRRQAVAAVAGVVVGAVVKVATGMLTQQWDLAWLAATVAFVVAGGGLLAWLTVRAVPDSAGGSPAELLFATTSDTSDGEAGDNSNAARYREVTGSGPRRRSR